MEQLFNTMGWKMPKEKAKRTDAIILMQHSLMKATLSGKALEKYDTVYEEEYNKTVVKEDEDKKPLWQIYGYMLNELSKEYFKEPTRTFMIQRRYMRTHFSIRKLLVDDFAKRVEMMNCCLPFFPRYNANKPKMFSEDSLLEIYKVAKKPS